MAMNLGAFSVSLTVKDLTASKVFYEKLGFEVAGGSEDENWLILKNGDHVLGLFHGMFDQNLLTFNPGWDQNGQEVDSFTDIRDLQTQLINAGIQPEKSVEGPDGGPGSVLLMDPDGNPILIDQHR